MGVDPCHHIRLGMSGVSLYRLDVPAAQLQLVSNAGVAETVENDLRQIMVLDQLL